MKKKKSLKQIAKIGKAIASTLANALKEMSPKEIKELEQSSAYKAFEESLRASRRDLGLKKPG